MQLKVKAVSMQQQQTNSTTTTTKRLLTAVLVLQGITLAGLWTGQPRPATAGAAIPDPGAQREAGLSEQKATNEKLDKLLKLLTSGEVRVSVEDNKQQQK
jgi:hypothetical protein